jgi:uncharacterized protein
MFSRFHLVLMVTHACPLRCGYCYTGAKLSRRMSRETARTALLRAIAALQPGGTLELGFFGGEPLLEAELIAEVVAEARARTTAAGLGLQVGFTTSGTAGSASAWSLLLDPGIDVALSHDGLPEVHDRHRVAPDGRGSSALTLATLRRMLEAGREVRVVVVVRPDTVERLPDGIAFLIGQGVRRFDLSLDLWTAWSAADGARLENALDACARSWAGGLPAVSINWLDESAARLAGIPLGPTARCGFGRGQVAVSPAGHLYPCERLIGEDAANNPMRLCALGDVPDFLELVPRPAAPDSLCRCSNFVRSGDPERPDALLRLAQALPLLVTARALNRRFPGRCP